MCSIITSARLFLKFEKFCPLYFSISSDLSISEKPENIFNKLLTSSNFDTSSHYCLA